LRLYMTHRDITARLHAEQPISSRACIAALVMLPEQPLVMLMFL
jgi:hypothetical protein